MITFAAIFLIAILQIKNIKRRKKVMIVIPIKEGDNIEKTLKKFKRKFEKTGVLRELRARQAFVKPSVVRRAEIKKAQYVQKTYERED